MSEPFLHPQPDGVLVSIKLQPRSSINQVGEPLGNELRIKVTAPPVDSAANEALVKFIAQALGCSRSQIELLRGHTSRHKVVKVHGLSEQLVARKLEQARSQP